MKQHTHYLSKHMFCGPQMWAEWSTSKMLPRIPLKASRLSRETHLKWAKQTSFTASRNQTILAQMLNGLFCGCPFRFPEFFGGCPDLRETFLGLRQRGVYTESLGRLFVEVFKMLGRDTQCGQAGDAFKMGRDRGLGLRGSLEETWRPFWGGNLWVFQPTKVEHASWKSHVGFGKPSGKPQ